MHFATSNNTPRNRRQNHHEDFMEDLQQALLENQKKYQVGIDEFQKVYKRKKLVSQTLDDYRRQNQNIKDNITRAKQRLYQIQQLNNRAIKQTVLMRNQIEKINEAHMMSKILMLQKIVKKEKETQEMVKKKNQYFRVRAQKYRSMLNRSDRNISRQQRTRNMSMIDSKALKDSIQQRKFTIFQQKKSKADEIRQATRRQKERLKRYEQFKLDRAKKNYLDKAIQMKEQLEMKEREFEQAYLRQLQQQKLYENTQKVTTEYINTLFPTQTI